MGIAKQHGTARAARSALVGAGYTLAFSPPGTARKWVHLDSAQRARVLAVAQWRGAFVIVPYPTISNYKATSYV